jgi:putative ABC transport system permease protein
MNALLQIFEVTAMNLRTLPARWSQSLVIVVGIGGVVAVLVALLAMGKGFESTLARTGEADRVIVLRGGSESELSGSFSIEQANVVSALPGVLRRGGAPLVSPELYLVADVPKRSTGSPANLPLRGVTMAAFAIRPELRIVQGRNIEPGKAEIVAGVGAADQFAGIDIGAEVRLRGTTLKVVGVFEANGGGHESEVWMDLATAQELFRGPGVLSSLRIQMQSVDAIAAFQSAVESDRRLDMKVLDEPTFYAGQSEAIGGLIRAFGYLVAGVMAVGALFAALNTMYSAVSARTREIATLRAIGFRGLPVVISVIVESMALALFGGAIGGALSYLMFNGDKVSTLNQSSFSQVAFDFAVTPDLIVQGLVIALTLGLLGGLLPASRAARVPVTTALRGE